MALECKHFKTIELPAAEGRDPYSVVLGHVIGIHIDESVLNDGLVDMQKLRPIARLGYMDYTVVDTVFSMDRP